MDPSAEVERGAYLRQSLERKGKHHAYTISDLSRCADEPIAFCGAAQTFGYLLVVNQAQEVIIGATQNWAELLKLESIREILGTPVHKVLGKTSLVDEFSRIPGRLHRILSFGRRFSQNDELIFEFECGESDRNDVESTLSKALFSEIKDIEDEQTALQHVTDRLRKDSNYDRVMIYRFDCKWNGEVVAESKRKDLDPFLNLKYPASDIPPQARELFLKNHPRLIPDVQAESVPIVMTTRSRKDINLSFANTRAVSPFHLQ